MSDASTLQVLLASGDRELEARLVAALPAEGVTIAARCLDAGSGIARSGLRIWRRVQGVPQIGVLPHPVAVAANGDDVAVVDEAIDQRRGHDVVAEDVTPVLEAFVRGENGRGGFVPATEGSD